MKDRKAIATLVSQLREKVEAHPELSPVLDIALNCLFVRAQQEAALGDLMDTLQSTFLDMNEVGRTVEWVQILSNAIDKENAR